MWTLRLRIRDDGSVDLASISDGIPAGEIEIRGTDDGNRVTLNARQRDARGRFTVSAHHTRDRAEEALHDLEACADEAIAAVAERPGFATGGFLSGEDAAVVAEAPVT